jgi:hypothetical protein
MSYSPGTLFRAYNTPRVLESDPHSTAVLLKSGLLLEVKGDNRGKTFQSLEEWENTKSIDGKSIDVWADTTKASGNNKIKK